jgi:hypothetical protein
MSLRIVDSDAFERLLRALQQLWRARGQPSSRAIQDQVNANRRLSVSHTTVAQILKGDRNPQLGVLLEIVAVLNGNRGDFKRLWEAAYGPTELRVEPGDCVGRLESPQAGAEVETRFQVKGVVESLPDQHHVWIAHQIDLGGLIWPKDYEVILDGDGRFERHVYAGGSSQDFFVLLLLTSEAGHAQFDDWMKEGGRTGHYPGIPPSPTRFLELDRVSVHSG